MRESAARMRRTQYRAQKILEAAMELFCEKGIEETSIEEIAEKAGVGSATIYRYYETKAGLAIQSGVGYWDKIADRYLNVTEAEGYPEMSGREQLEHILDALIAIFEEERGFLKYLQEFEVFVRKYEIDMERLAEYEECIMSLKPMVTDALGKGLRDGSLAFEWSPDEVCYSLAHTVFGVMKRFAWNGSMLELDSCVGLVLQVKIAVKLLIRGLAAGTAQDPGRKSYYGRRGAG